jgi:hypothetical protein
VCEAGCLKEIGYDFATLDTRIVVFVNQERLDDDKNLVDIRAYKVIKFIQDPGQ